MNESVIECNNAEFLTDEKGFMTGKTIDHPATWCMVCQDVIHDVYLLDHGIHHCAMCLDEDEINSITNAKYKRAGKKPDDRELSKTYARFRQNALENENINIVNSTQLNTIKCTHGKWNKKKTSWKWVDKWFCNLCSVEFSTKEKELDKKKKEHETKHKEQQLKKHSRDRGDPILRVVWILREDRRESRELPKYVKELNETLKEVEL